MSQTQRSPSNGTPERHLMLFVAGDEANSIIAQANLEQICHANGCAGARVEVVDVLEDVERAFEHRILVTPSLLQLAPGPRVLIIGNLSDQERVRSALGLELTREARG